jgi:molecular chaperone GrpE
MLFRKRKKENRMDHTETDPTMEHDTAPNEETVVETPQTATENPLAKENAELKEQVEELKDKYLRLHAEFDNYKRRNLKEMAESRSLAGRDTMSALLPILDDFGRASKNETFSEGINLLFQKLVSTLKNKGLKEMESTGQSFDPEHHEAITEIPVPTEEMKGKVIDTVESGYTLNDKIIRHAKVVVGK